MKGILHWQATYYFLQHKLSVETDHEDLEGSSTQGATLNFALTRSCLGVKHFVVQNIDDAIIMRSPDWPNTADVNLTAEL